MAEPQWPLMAVKDGQLGNITPVLVMVESESDLTTILHQVQPGSIAYLAGFGTLWQLDASETWQGVE